MSTNRSPVRRAAPILLPLLSTSILPTLRSEWIWVEGEKPVMP